MWTLKLIESVLLIVDVVIGVNLIREAISIIPLFVR